MILHGKQSKKDPGRVQLPVINSKRLTELNEF